MAINEKYPELSFSNYFYVCGDESQFIEQIDKKNDNFQIVINTFRYIFYKFQKGYFIYIVDGKINVVPFKNVNFENEWYKLIEEKNNFKSVEDIKNFIIFSSLYSKYWYIKTNYRYNKSFDYYYNKNKRSFILDKYEINIKKWYANNSIFRYDKNSNDKKNINEIIEMLTELSRTYNLPNTEFFINMRDSPILKVDNTEPYTKIFGNVKLLSHRYEKYIPILSFSKSVHFKDLLIPTFEDWKLCNTISDYCIDWDSKINKVVFRGSTTGFGYNFQNNVRLKLCSNINIVNNKFKDFLDVGINKLQLRPRIDDGKINFIENVEQIILKDYLSPKQQSEYKYILHIEGNVSAFRLSSELRMGCCLLIVQSEWNLWFSKYLKPYVHFIPIKSDLSDLCSKLTWIQNNEIQCKNIALNSLEFSKYFLNRENILKYLNSVLDPTTAESETYN